MLVVKLNWRVWKKLADFSGEYLAGWRGTVERERACKAQLTEGHAFACASGRNAPASARRRLVRAVRNMVGSIREVEWFWGWEMRIA
jgi:hypothetical protein